MSKERIFWARQCGITGEGMNEGYLYNDHEYIANDKDLIDTLRGQDFTAEDEDGNQLYPSKMTDEELMEWAYNDEIYYWTDWVEDEDIQYEEIDGKLVDIQEYTEEEQAIITNTNN